MPVGTPVVEFVNDVRVYVRVRVCVRACMYGCGVGGVCDLP